MLPKEMKKLDKDIRKLDKAIQGIYDTMYDILSNPEKVYEFSFKKNTYKTFIPFTKKDKDLLKKMKKDYFKQLFRYVVQKRLRILKPHDKEFYDKLYHDLYAHAGGEDAAHFKTSPEQMKELKKTTAEKDKIYGKRRPFNVESWAIATQMLSEEDQKRIEHLIKTNQPIETMEQEFPAYMKAIKKSFPEEYDKYWEKMKELHG